MKSLFYGLLILFLLTSNANARGGRHYSSYGGGQVNSSSEPTDNAKTYPIEHKLLRLVNLERQRYGLHPLVLDRKLHLRSRQHGWWMARNYSMVHSYGVAENIAMGQTSAEDVMNSWMNSSGHRANILNPSYRKIGLCGYKASNGVAFWCQQFE